MSLFSTRRLNTCSSLSLIALFNDFSSFLIQLSLSSRDVNWFPLPCLAYSSFLRCSAIDSLKGNQSNNQCTKNTFFHLAQQQISESAINIKAYLYVAYQSNLVGGQEIVLIVFQKTLTNIGRLTSHTQRHYFTSKLCVWMLRMMASAILIYGYKSFTHCCVQFSSLDC